MNAAPDGIFFVGILCIAIASYGIISKIRGREKTVLIVLDDDDKDNETIKKGAEEAGADLNVKVVFATSLDEDIAEYSPNSIVFFSETKEVPEEKGNRMFDGLGKQNRPADSFAAGYLAVLTARVDFMAEKI